MKSTMNNTTAQEKSQMNVQETNKQEWNSKNDPKQLYQNIEIAETPFRAIKVEEKWFLTMGKYRISETFETYEECADDAFNTSWNRIMTIMQIMIDENNNTKTE